MSLVSLQALAEAKFQRQLQNPLAALLTSVACRNSWLRPVLAPLLPHMLERISAKWSRIVSQSGSSPPGDGARHSEDGAAASDEVVEERLIRELTREHLQLLLNMVEKPAPSPGKP